jgi:hypothetical protein
VAQEHSNVQEGKAKAVSLVEWPRRCQWALWQASRILTVKEMNICWLLPSFFIKWLEEKRKEADSKFQGGR